jgi:hypothetical protein
MLHLRSPRPTQAAAPAQEDQRLRAALHSASLDAPRADLWPRLQPAARQQAATRPRWWWRFVPTWQARRVALAFVSLVLIAAIAASAWEFFRMRAATLATTGTVPDTLLLTTYDQHAQSSSVAAMHAGTQQITPILDGTNMPVISPDGKLLVFTETTKDNGRWHTTLVAYNSATLAPLWRVPVDDSPYNASTNSPYLAFMSTVAISSNRVYLAGYHYQVDKAEPIVITAYDRASGQKRETWQVDVGLPGRMPSGNVGLYVTPSSGSNQSLVLIATTGVLGQQNNMQPQDAYFRFHLPDGKLAARVAPVAQSSTQPPFYYIGQSQPTADGQSLYRVNYANPGNLAVVFFDLPTGTIQPPLLAPLGGTTANDYVPYEQAVSNDGRTLYMFAPTRGQLAIVDLPNRRLVQVVQIANAAQGTPGASRPAPSLLERVWHGLRGLVVREAAAKFDFQGAMQVSPDGHWLYAISATGASYEATANGVLVIDMTTWRVVDRWLPGQEPNALALSNDGKHLYVNSWQSDGNSQTARLRAIDTSSSASVFETTLPAAAGSYVTSFSSLADLYRDRYGRSPRTPGGQTAAQPFIPPAAIVPSVNPTAVTAGDRVTIEARFVDPQSGNVVTPGQQGVRYDAPTSVTATLCPPEQGNGCQSTPITLTQATYGVYRGDTTAPDAGVFTVQVTAHWADGSYRSAVPPSGPLTVQPAFKGMDNHRYILKLSADPAQPVVNQEATLRATFVDADTGAPLPENVSLVDGLPAELEADLFAPAGVSGRTLKSVGHGVYQGPVKLFSAQTWTVRISFTDANGKLITFASGTLQGVAK